MTLPAGFLGGRGDLLMDLVILSFVIILPVLILSWYQVRQKQYLNHKRIQLTLGITLAIAVILFETDLRLAGGIFELTKASSYHGTATLNGWIWGHMIVSIATSLVWVILIPLSLKKFPTLPRPNSFSRHHIWLGQLGMILMMATGFSALPLYYYGFML
jgi:putative membrane protein